MWCLVLWSMPYSPFSVTVFKSGLWTAVNSTTGHTHDWQCCLCANVNLSTLPFTLPTTSPSPGMTTSIHEPSEAVGEYPTFPYSPPVLKYGPAVTMTSNRAHLGPALVCANFFAILMGGMQEFTPVVFVHSVRTM